MVGKTFSYFFIGNFQGGPNGEFDVMIADMAIMHADGTVTPFPTSVGALGWGGDNTDETGESFVGEQVGAASGQVGALEQTHYFLADHLGTTQMELASGGWPVWKGEYTPFGEEIRAQATANNYKFTGKERDAESGLDNFGARYYGSSMGRFMSPDWSATAEPVPYAKLNNPQSLNLYSYVLNNPISRLDADGHIDCTPYGGNSAACATDAANQGASLVGTAAQQQSGSSTQSKPASAKGQKQINAAYQLACSHSADGCSFGQQATIRYVGFTYNVQIAGDVMDPSTLPDDAIKDPGITNKIFHKGAPDSFYLSSPLGMAGTNVPHVVDDPAGIEAHVDHFGPANPIHWGEAILSLFINTRAQAGGGFTQTCSPGGGCQ